jgi:prevent-host-death family protein
MPARRKKPITEVAISEFRAKWLSLLEEVSKTKTPLRVTRRDKAVADVVPAAPAEEEKTWTGSLEGKMEIHGDIVSPAINLREIEALKR